MAVVYEDVEAREWHQSPRPSDAIGELGQSLARASGVCASTLSPNSSDCLSSRPKQASGRKIPHTVNPGKFQDAAVGKMAKYLTDNLQNY